MDGVYARAAQAGLRMSLGEAALPLVAIVGRPNVGKSTLFNRLVGGHAAIVEDEPGVTRDRRYGETDWVGRHFRVVDTGGLDFAPARPTHEGIAKAIVRQALRAVEEAEVIVFVLDAREGITPADREAAEVLRRASKPLVWVANKVDGAKHEPAAAELYELGAPEVFAVSASHGRGVGELLDAVVAALPQGAVESALDEAETQKPIRLALVGRPNAGKSSLVNRLIGEERVIVDATPGTTRDPVDIPLRSRGRDYLLVDTAGIRRRARVELAMEKIAVAMAEKTLGRVDVAVLVIDAEAGVGEQDAKIAGLAEEAGRALVIAFNKRDLVPRERERELAVARDRQLQFVPWAKVVFCSARTGRGMGGLLDAVAEVHEAAGRRVSTGALNRFFEGLVERHPPPIYKGHPIKLYYITQVGVHPPTFVLSVNYPVGVHFSYRRYLMNQLREHFGFEGTPVRLICRKRGGDRS